MSAIGISNGRKEYGIRNTESGTIKSFTDLFAWKQAHALVLSIYGTTREFPKEEQFGLSSQMRRAAISITSNIAEGFSRHSYREKVQFYAISLGSLTEIQSQLLVARDIHYITEEEFHESAQLAVKVHKLITGLLKKSKTFILNS